MPLDSTMKFPSACAILAFSALVSLAAAAQPPAGRLIPAAKVDPAWLEAARKDYPLKTCVVAGGKLGGMGDPTEHVWRVEGKADRLVKFCCDGCIEDFLEAPEKAMAKVEAARNAAQPARR